MNKKYIALWAAIFIIMQMVIVVLLPGILVKKTGITGDSGGIHDGAKTQDETEGLDIGVHPVMVPVYLSGQKKVEQFPLEYYVRGVLAAEVPIEFQPEALKAQAIATRTYIVRRLLDRDHSNVPDQAALVTDQTAHQVYMSVEEMKEKWRDADFRKNLAKLNEAVNQTRGLIMTYRKQPIEAAFFSTSNGYTENSEDYWSEYLPYLRSVASPWDENLSPKFTATVTYNLKDFTKKLGVSWSTREAVPLIRVLEMTKGHRIKTIQIKGRIFSGREVREKLDLNSSEFTWKVGKDQIEITTYGYGHGVGMSQWGADGMAETGKTAREILAYYYQGIQIENMMNIGQSFS